MMIHIGRTRRELYSSKGGGEKCQLPEFHQGGKWSFS